MRFVPWVAWGAGSSLARPLMIRHRDPNFVAYGAVCLWIVNWPWSHCSHDSSDHDIWFPWCGWRRTCLKPCPLNRDEALLARHWSTFTDDSPEGSDNACSSLFLSLELHVLLFGGHLTPCGLLMLLIRHIYLLKTYQRLQLTLCATKYDKLTPSMIVDEEICALDTGKAFGTTNRIFVERCFWSVKSFSLSELRCLPRWRCEAQAGSRWACQGIRQSTNVVVGLH